MKKILNFIVYSSENPDKVSLTVKGVLLGLVPYIMYANEIACRVGDYCWNVEPNTLRLVAEDLATVIALGLTALASVMTAYGAGRKVMRTITGQNKAIQ